jgi:hypothetical protein
MAVMKRLLANLFKILFAGLVIIILSPAEDGFAAKGKAYIWVGDINPPWYSLAIRSVNPLGPVDPYKELESVISAQRKKMEEMGYEVVVVDAVSAHEIEKAIRDPQTKAFAFFGHGDQKVAGTMSTLGGEDITAGDIKNWAQEELVKKIGTPRTWRNLSVEERKKRFAAWNDAHLDLKYVYMHTCYGLKDNSMVDAVIADDGEFRGYKDKAYTDDRSVTAKNEMGRLGDRLKELQNEHDALKKKLDDSGGYDRETAKKMEAISKEFQKVRADIEKKKISQEIITGGKTVKEKDDEETTKIASIDKGDEVSKDGKGDGATKSKQSVKDKRTEKKEQKEEKQLDDKDIELRNKVIAALKGRRLPSLDALVDRLVDILDHDGESAFNAALKDITNMQGTFKGSNMTLTVKDFNVSGTFFEQSEYTTPDAKVIITVTDGKANGWVDPVAGTITIDLTLVTQTEGRTQQINQKLVGSFTGRGYQGHIAGEEDSKWKVETN